MVMAETARKYWRPEDVQALPYGRERYECIHGELFVTPSPRDLHQAVVGELYALLHAHFKGRAGLQLRLSPADIQLEPDTLVQPDLFVTRLERKTLREQGWTAVQRMALVIEVLSPGSVRQDRGKKRELYMRTGVEDYWMVNIDTRAVERWRPGYEAAEIVTGVLEWRDAVGGASFTVDLPELFATVFAD